jgi:peptidyl-prolyl cis-trans isomerase B (cyclophilin B)
MKKLFLCLCAAVLGVIGCAPKPEKEVVMVVETTMGTVEFKLYNETPLHRDNFIKLAEQHYFDSLLFHRVIDNFVIQGGDPNSKYAQPGELLGDGEPDWRVPAEFRLDKGIFHRKGTVNAAREGDDTNPDRESCASQFCFMMGSPMTDEQLDRAQARLDANTGGQVKLTPEMRQVYKEVGGSPHLDGQYTVFGEVVSGMEVLEAIQKVATDDYDRPLEDVRMLRVYRKE